MGFFPRNPISEENARVTCEHLQKVVVALVDLALVSKQAHWNVYGTQFLSVHEKLDEIVETARKGADAVAERMAQLGHSPDGRVSTLQSQSPYEPFPDGFQPVSKTLTLMCDRLLKCSQDLRAARKPIGDADAPTDDLLQGIIEPIEEHLWMLQAMEKSE